MGEPTNKGQDANRNHALIKAMIIGLVLPLILQGLWMRHLVRKHYSNIENDGPRVEHPVIADTVYPGPEYPEPSVNTQKMQRVEETKVVSQEKDQLVGDTFMTVNKASGRPESISKRLEHPEMKGYDDRIEELRRRVDESMMKVIAGDVNNVDVMDFVSLGNQLFVRERIFNMNGADTEEILWCYKFALKVIIPASQFDQKASQFCCTIHGNMGEALFVADMFDESTDAFSEALKYNCDRHHINKLTYYRGNNYMIMGKYDKFATDYVGYILRDDRDMHYYRVLEKIARVLDADESVIPGGWEWLQKKLMEILPETIEAYERAPTQKEKDDLARGIQLIQYSLFNYYDKVTDDKASALYYLDESQKWKRRFVDYYVPSNILEQQYQREAGRFTHEVIRASSSLGIQSRVPIFILGFPRSGTTLLERILDAHPDVFGLGERSVMFSYAQIAQTVIFGHLPNLRAIPEYANEVLNGMNLQYQRHKHSLKIGDSSMPLRLVDKQNMNFNHIAIIHTLFPNALILHVVRDPMDVLFSNYKYDFMGKNLENKDQDFTCEFESLSKFYIDYRRKMDHWDKILPGRITHIRYEDLVDDLPRVARGVIKAAGLEWKDEMLSFHDKMHAVNTYSATQVRKGIYSHSINSWKKYGEYLQPLQTYVKNYANYEVQTNLPGYVRPDSVNEL